MKLLPTILVMCAVAVPVWGRQGGGASTPDAAAAARQVSAPEAVLLDDVLSARRVRLLQLDGRNVKYVDDQQRRRQMPWRSVLALLPVTADDAPLRIAPPRTTPGMIDLVDGQRFIGELAVEDASSEMVVWVHASFGSLPFALERVDSFYRTGVLMEQRLAGGAAAGTTDETLLSNGDRVAGFLDSVGSTVRVESGGQMMELPLERVAGARLANAREAAKGARVWLADGTVAMIESITLESPDRMSLILPGGASASMEWSALRAVVFDAARLVALAEIEPRLQEPGVDRRYGPPLERRFAKLRSDPFGLTGPALGAADLVLPGPMVVEWDLPPGAERVSMSLGMDAGTYPWGDCEVVISVDGAEVLRRRLQGGQPAAEINIEATGEVMRVEVVAGKYGPIMDRVVLGRALVLVGGE